MSRTLLGLYKNPKPEDAEMIYNNARIIAEAKEKGWICLCVHPADTPDEVVGEDIANAFVEVLKQKYFPGLLDEDEQE